MPEPMCLVGTTGEGAPGDQPPVTNEEVEWAPAPTPAVSTLNIILQIPCPCTVQCRNFVNTHLAL